MLSPPQVASRLVLISPALEDGLLFQPAGVRAQTVLFLYNCPSFSLPSPV